MYVWRWFCDLTDWRDSSFGVGALSHQEIEAWSRLFRVDIGPSEVEAIRQLDREFRAYHNEKTNKEEDKPQSLSESLQAVKKSQEPPKPKRAKKSNG